MSATNLSIPVTPPAPAAALPPTPATPGSHSRLPTRKTKKELPPLTPHYALGILSSALGYVREAGIEVVIGNHPELGAVIAIKQFRAVVSAAGQPPDLALATNPLDAMTNTALADDPPASDAPMSVAMVGQTEAGAGKPD